MTLDKLKSEYKKSITLEGDDLEQITEEIDEADTLDEFIAIAGIILSTFPFFIFFAHIPAISINSSNVSASSISSVICSKSSPSKVMDFLYSDFNLSNVIAFSFLR